MTNFEVDDHVKFAGGLGENTKIEDHRNEYQLLHVYTAEGHHRKLTSGLPRIGWIHSIVDRPQPDRSIRQFTTASEHMQPTMTPSTGDSRLLSLMINDKIGGFHDGNC